MKVAARFGPARLDEFRIDAAVGLELPSRVEAVPVAPVLVVDTVAAPPPMRIYPVASQVADKLAAMYEVHRGRPSSRYRDLVDLVLILQNLTFEAADARTAIKAECLRRGLDFSLPLQLPGEQWRSGYRTEASSAGLDRHLRDVDVALRLLDSCVTPIMDGSPVSSWNSEKRAWNSVTP
ncbi:MAG: nucleotidyl transferase AbiEii/AbiGii toxin family protein [Dermatophilus congolensis]|nr:nucleotidyl transferase AbiEii/AbiGii toxin family protein [Dermatophilus congolensis]